MYLKGLRLPLLVILVFFLVSPSRADAQYLDPGAGSVILQAIIAAAVGIAMGLKLYWRKLTGLFIRRSRRDVER